jgi:SAM-dependent methyltransferase
LPTLEQNSDQWSRDYNWLQQGEEWSRTWGGSQSQWFGALLVRLHSYIPAHRILEIAPGYGRWTYYLKDYCKHLVIVDLSEPCIQACRERFSSYRHIDFHVNDGKSLSMIPDESCDFVFSFDSLVHAEADVLEYYLLQLAKKLSSNGVGFIHHSNLGAYADGVTGELPNHVLNPHWRAKSMSSKLFEEFCDNSGLQCISQETVNWGGELLTDCFSIFTRKASIWARRNETFQNPQFMAEAEYLSQLARLYSKANAVQIELKR